MNTNILKTIGIFTAGAIVGAISAVIFCKNQLEKNYEQIFQEEITSMREVHEKNKSRMHSRIIPDREKKVELSSLIKRYNGGDTEAADAMADTLERPMDDVEYHKHEEMSMNANYMHETFPYVISIEQYNEEMDHFDKITLIYYENDNTLVDENEDIIADIDNIIGGALNRFGDSSQDPDIVYVRNERMAIDYEVIRVDKSFAEEVGIKGR